MQGRYVCVEVKVRMEADETSGFLQAGKYRTLLAMSEGLEFSQVRTIVTAEYINPALIEKFANRYQIEWKLLQI